MSLRQLLTSACLLASSTLIKAQYNNGGGNEGGYGSGNGNGNQGSQATSYNAGGGYGTGNQGSQGNQGNQATGNNGGGGGGWSSWSQAGETATALAQTVSIVSTETMMATATVTESCSTSGNALASYTTGWAPPVVSPPGTVLVQVVHVSDNNASLSYFPDNIVAAPGTLVEFVFYPKVRWYRRSLRRVD